MPLIKSGGKEAVGKNIKTEMAAGRPQKQAVAIALDNQRRSGGGGKKFQAGGAVTGAPPPTGMATAAAQPQGGRFQNAANVPTLPAGVNTGAQVGFNKGGSVELSGEVPFVENLAETAANPTEKLCLAKGGSVKPATGGWKRWGQR
jgi:hypothetical protein